MDIEKSDSRGWVTVALCFLVATFEGVDLQAAGLVAPKVAPLFKLTPEQMGWFLSASAIGLLIGALAGGRLADRLGRKRTLIIAVGLFGAFSVATALSTGYEMLLATRFLTGLGLGGALPNLIALASENAPANRRNTAVSLMYCGMPFGGGLASLLIALGLGGDNWKLLFYVGGWAPLVAIPILLWALPESGRFRTAAATGRTDVAGALFGEGRAATTLTLWVAFFCALLVLYLLLNWLPSLLVSRGLPRPEAAFVQAMFNLLGMGGAVIAGLTMDGNRRRWAAGAIFIGLAISLVVLAAAPATFGIALLTGAAVGAGSMGAQSVLYGLSASLYPTRIRGTGVGAAVSAGRLGSIAGPLLAGVLVGQGQSVYQVLMALLPLVLVSGLISLVLAGKSAADH